MKIIKTIVLAGLLVGSVHTPKVSAHGGVEVAIAAGAVGGAVAGAAVVGIFGGVALVGVTLVKDLSKKRLAEVAHLKEDQSNVALRKCCFRYFQALEPLSERSDTTIDDNFIPQLEQRLNDALKNAEKNEKIIVASMKSVRTYVAAGGVGAAVIGGGVALMIISESKGR